MDANGRLVPVTAKEGKAPKYLRDKLLEKIVDPEEQVVAISHGDVLEKRAVEGNDHGKGAGERGHNQSYRAHYRFSCRTGYHCPVLPGGKALRD